MKDLSSLLRRFQRSLGNDTEARDAVRSVVESLAGIKLGPEEISIKEGTLEITTSPGKKNEIRLKEEYILDALNTGRGLHLKKIFYK